MSLVKPNYGSPGTSARTARLVGLILLVAACGQGTTTSEAVETNRAAKIVVGYDEDFGTPEAGTRATIIVPETDEDLFWDAIGKTRDTDDNLRFVQGGAVTAGTAPASAQISTVTNDGSVLFEPDDGPYLVCWLRPAATGGAPPGAEDVWTTSGCSRVTVNGPAQWQVSAPHDAGTQIYEVSNG